MSFSKWEVRPAVSSDTHYNFELYRIETGGIFEDREEAEHIAYELNREANDGADQ